MALSKKRVAAIALLAIGALGTTAAWSQDAMKIVQERQALMKRQGKDLGAIRAFGAGKGNAAAAEAAATDLAQTTRKIPTLFPPGTGMAEFPGKSGAKPAIWTEPDKFLAAQKNTVAKVDALAAALKSGGAAAAATGWKDLWDNGCQGCHKSFREKI